MSQAGGFGQGTPNQNGAGVAGDSSLSLPYTYLSLPRYAKIMGINPAHFCRAHAPSVNPSVFPVSTCSNVWPRFSWQNDDQVSHEELAFAIQSAESDLMGYAGYPLAPDWIVQEPHQIEREADRQFFSDGLDIRGQVKKVQTNMRKVINCGVRKIVLVGQASSAGGSLVYQDLDGDGVCELAVITMATTLTIANELHVYFSGTNANRDWEIRPAKSKVISGGVATIKFDSWLLIDPELLSDYPTSDGFRAIDISTTVNFVSGVDVYRETNDNTVTSAEFVWQGVEYPATGTAFTPNNTLTNTQNGVGLVEDGELGLVIPVPATYNAVTSQWTTDTWVENVAPDYVRLSYYSGEYSNAYLRGYTTDPLSDFWAQTIAWVATARLTRPLCGCQSAADLAEHLADDLSLSEPGKSHFTPVEIMRNPLGARRGEVMAWRRISKLLRDRKVTFALV